MKKSKNILYPILFLMAWNYQPSIILDYRGLVSTSDSIRYFTIYNRGNGDLKIEDFTSSCECTAIQLKKNQIIKPKDSIRVVLKVSQNQDADNTVFVTVKTNAKPRLSSFHFKP